MSELSIIKIEHNIAEMIRENASKKLLLNNDLCEITSCEADACLFT